MTKQAKILDIRKRGRPRTNATKLCVSLNPNQFKIVVRAAKQHGVTWPEALRRMAFIGLSV